MNYQINEFQDGDTSEFCVKESHLCSSIDISSRLWDALGIIKSLYIIYKIMYKYLQHV